MKISGSRKASIEMSLTQVIGMVLAVMLVIVSISIINGLMNLMMKNPDQGTQEQYIKMLDSIEALYDPDNQNTSCKLELGYIEPDFAFVGFNKEGIPCKDCDSDETFVEEKCGWFDDNIERPTSCLDRACLCLCHGGLFDVSGEDCFTGTCTRLNKEIKVMRTTIDKKEVDLVLYGESCIGKDHHVLAGYYLNKASDGKLFIKGITDGKLLKSLQGPDCGKMIEDMGRGKKKATPDASGQTQQADVTEAIDKIQESN